MIVCLYYCPSYLEGKLHLFCAVLCLYLRPALALQFFPLHGAESFLPEKLTGLQLVKKFPAFYGNRRFVTAFTNARYLSLSWASPVHTFTSHYLKINVNITFHLHLGLPSGLFPSGFPTKTLYTPLPSPYALHALSITFSILSAA
jgi:hypothetical protein